MSRRDRLRTAGGLLLGLLVLAGADRVLAQEAGREARVRVVSFVPADPLRVRVRPTRGGDALRTGLLRPGEPTRYFLTAAGRYEVEVIAGGRVVERTPYGLGAGGRYTLVVAGRVAPGAGPGRETLHARLRWIFGGADGVAADGYLPQTRLLQDRRDLDPARAHVRVVHVAPTLMPVEVTAGREGRRTVLASGLRYPRLGPLRELEPGRRAVRVGAVGSPLSLARADLRLEAGTLTTLFVSGGPGTDRLRVVPVVSRIPQRGPSR